MKNNEGKEASSSARIPPYWTSSIDSRGETTLTYAIRGGKAQVMLATLGATAVSCGIGFIAWMVYGGGLTIAGVVLMIVIGGALLAFGAHCLDTVFLARSEYLLRRSDFIACRSSMWGKKRTEIQRSALTGITQTFYPPGTWTTFLIRPKKVGKGIGDFPLDGQRSVEEARWLGPLLAKWAGVPLTRSFGGGLEEADEKELPSLDA